ncbi:hypothetical protein DER45DRAFT_611684 [Fusarium avenaceum]|nr:hypothetical protein DER45DRAFT_611684 [Fusarium avenaceum]
MTPKILLTGVTGFVGGTTFSKIHDTHPDYDYTLYVRNEDRAKAIAEKYPNAKLVYGDLESTDVIEKAASEADVVVHTLSRTHNDMTTLGSLHPRHCRIRRFRSGGQGNSGILTWYDLKHKHYGEAPLPEQNYNDIHNIDRILNLPEETIHKDVDNIVQNIDSDAVRSLIVAPPVIYGIGKGLINKSSITVPTLTKATFDLGYAPFVGAGKAKWDNVHVEDLADLLIKCVEASQYYKKDSPVIWGNQAYYFVTDGEHQWKDLSAWIAEEAHRQGYISEPKTKPVAFEEAVDKGYKAVIAWGISSKSEAERARKYLGWEAKGPSLKETIAEAVMIEAEALGLTPKYR